MLEGSVHSVNMVGTSPIKYKNKVTVELKRARAKERGHKKMNEGYKYKF